MDKLNSDVEDYEEAKSKHDDILDILEKEGLDGIESLSDDDDIKNDKIKEPIVFLIFVFINSL